MEISVWDTYVTREDGKIMHFDILVPSNLKDEETILGFGKHYLKSKPFKILKLTANECRFCHIEHATGDMIIAIKDKGYTIIEMENCN
ncbi:DUF2024 family protein [Flavobacteriaceae bacterium AU392]|nr:DUF2024 family protein [Flavobacteriaceae bacterium]RKM85831.1 DUF2024 family protein [Flavobacteriaceae bacterium AU392]